MANKKHNESQQNLDRDWTLANIEEEFDRIDRLMTDGSTHDIAENLALQTKLLKIKMDSFLQSSYERVEFYMNEMSRLNALSQKENIRVSDGKCQLKNYCSNFSLPTIREETAEELVEYKNYNVKNAAVLYGKRSKNSSSDPNDDSIGKTNSPSTGDGTNTRGKGKRL
ncbi:uncharacterized protein LOC119685673 [Teleopsis dalmanni]|uniref:uncharacterized protein LOC119685673 n=1 Tax=Teleopsis dalmanni TaxID=139649 RepID=UPI0018CDBD86|nr:uncharacterized protein LOC119685673 [Teleopsis dalmanni]